MLNIIEKLAPISKCRSGRQRTGFSGVTIHNTGNAEKTATALAHANYLRGSGKDITMSWHYVIDSTNIYRCIPENEAAWHAGDGQGDGNFKTIAIEICMNPETNLLVATDNTAELTANILKRNGVFDVKNFVHQHNRWSGKNCPQMLREGKPYDWNTFLSKVNDFLNPVITPSKIFLTVSTKIFPLILNKSFNGKTATGGRLLLMPKGAKVELLQKMNSAWYKVKYNGTIGYASAEYLR